MTEKRFGFEMDKNCYKCIADVIDKKLYTDKKQVVDLLNSLSEDNEQLKKEKENWKSSACSNANFNSILLNELSIAQEQGYEVSDPFKELMKEKGDVE